MKPPNTEREKRRQNHKGYACLLHEARAHALGAESLRHSPVLGQIVKQLGTLETEAMLELHQMGTRGEGNPL